MLINKTVNQFWKHTSEKLESLECGVQKPDTNLDCLQKFGSERENHQVCTVYGANIVFQSLLFFCRKIYYKGLVLVQ